MRRPAKRLSPKLSADSQRLISFSQAIAQSSSRLEERAWEKPLDSLLHKQLKSSHQDLIDAALDNLFKNDLDAYDVLVEAVEANSESCSLEHDGTHYDVLLLALPVLAWTRFSIASGTIPADIGSALFAHMHAHLLATGVQLAISPTLHAIEQLPRHHAEVFALTQRMGLAALNKTALAATTEQTPTAPFLADTRYLIAAVVTPAGHTMFRWQSVENPQQFATEKTAAMEAWNTQVTPLLTRFLPGCNVELLLPQAYYFACREADKRIRPAAIRAADHYLTQTLDIASSDLHASIGGFGEDLGGPLDEYRIGFTLGADDNVVYGIVWPLYEQEDGNDMMPPSVADESLPRTPIEEILSALRECGIVHVKLHAERFAMEFCDDCGTPLFPNPEGDLVHAEMPEDMPASTEHFH